MKTKFTIKASDEIDSVSMIVLVTTKDGRTRDEHKEFVGRIKNKMHSALSVNGSTAGGVGYNVTNISFPARGRK